MAGSRELPPGFRFHPTDEELIMHYLRNQAMSRPCPVSIIPELNIYKFDPWELPEKAVFGEEEWYFFSPRDRKYPNGTRPNRATASGYWKATGTDKAVYSKSQYVGVKKALVFYKGRPPKGTKTSWVMHEYRLGVEGPPSKAADVNLIVSSCSSSTRFDEWVLCRIYQKKQQKRSAPDQGGAAQEEDGRPSAGQQADMMMVPRAATRMSSDHHVVDVEQPPAGRFPRSCSLAHLLEAAEFMPLSQMLSEYSAYAGDSLHAMAIDYSDVIGGFGGGGMHDEDICVDAAAADVIKFKLGGWVQPTNLVNLRVPVTAKSGYMG